MAISLPIKIRNTKERGNMLVMIALIGGIIVVVLTIGLTVSLILFAQQKGRQRADELALTLANVLNKDDRQGQMNNLVERSRELVYSSRKAYDDCRAEEFLNMEPLMRDLLEESRTGAVHVDKTRQCLSDLTVCDLTAAQKEFSDRLKQLPSLNLSLLKTAAPTLQQLEIGSIDKVNSNVFAPAGFAELKSMDERNGIADPKSGIYSGNINAKLPGPDGDLDFKLSPLAAPVGTTISSSRLTDAGVFKQSKVLPIEGSSLGAEAGIDGSKSDEEKRKAAKVDQIPSAVKVKLAVGVLSGGKNPLQDQLGITSAATTGGAQPAPDLP